MKTNAPRVITWVIALVLGLSGIIGQLAIKTGFLAENAFWLVAAGFVILLLGSSIKGL
ncbi:MAG TPA: hypothetical protein PKD70_09660 [Saprospiraceae bacterium]|nr:hypothetical protein [Saprospiraceae bacterium]HMP14133.1 hypothetical protein [Saprospiraceae bacterium]